jgi:hypothetical protein
MYPGYSPADHKYGQAAEEFGRTWAQAKRKGVDFPSHSDGPEYEFGQGKGAKRRKSDSAEKPNLRQDQDMQDTPMNDATDDTTTVTTNAPQLFIIDSNPTPINVAALQGKKHASLSNEPDENKSKKSKKSHNPISPDTVSQGKAKESFSPVIEYENIDAEVDAALREKKARWNGEKAEKRKRESDSSNDERAAQGSENTAGEGGNVQSDRPKKKKSKKNKDHEEAKGEAVDSENKSKDKTKNGKDKSKTKLSKQHSNSEDEAGVNADVSNSNEHSGTNSDDSKEKKKKSKPKSKKDKEEKA